MAKWLMDKNQQPSVTQELGRLFPSIRGRGRRGESSELLRVGAGESSASATDTNNTSFAIRSTTKRTIEEIWGSKATSKKPLKSMSHKTTSGKTPSKFPILSWYITQWFQICYLVHVISQVWSSATVVWSFPNKKWVILSHFNLVQKEYRDFEVVLLRQMGQRKHVLIMLQKTV